MPMRLFTPRAAARSIVLALASLAVTVSCGCGREEPPARSDATPDPAPPTVAPAPPQEPPAMRSITGTVAYRARIALPPGAVVRVVLEDVSRADAPATAIAETEVLVEGRQVPIPFALDLGERTLDPRARHALRATIEVEGGLRFATATAHPVAVDRGSLEGIEIVVEPVAPEAPPDPEPAAPAPPSAPIERIQWSLVEIEGAAALPGMTGRPAGFVLAPETGSFAANASVNNLAGGYALSGSDLSFKPGPMTLMAGPEPLMAQERAFVAALMRVDGFALQGDRLLLRAGEETLLIFERRDWMVVEPEK